MLLIFSACFRFVGEGFSSKSLDLDRAGWMDLLVFDTFILRRFALFSCI
jgi:hypothetical protein